MNNDGTPTICKSKKMKLGQQNNDEGSNNFAEADEKATLKFEMYNSKRIIIKTLA